ncbi:MAG TPA: PAS domain S-box protein, partial [Polyangiaceae bacterium]|nr:PAS domain S-box protein [Polyangiaceae bacterium]
MPFLAVRHYRMMCDEGQYAGALQGLLSGEGPAALDAIIGSASDVIGVVDPDFVIRYVNWTAPGLTREAVVGHSVFNLVPPGYVDVARDAFETVLKTASPSSFETMYRNEHGVLIWMVRVGPIVHAGQVIGLVTINTDVTEQRRGEADRDRFFALSNDMLVVFTEKGRFKRINPAFSEMLGFDWPQLSDKLFIEFVHPDDVATTMTRFAEAQSGNPTGNFENRYRRRDGTYRVLSWRGTVDPVTGDGYAVARDVTEQRAAESRLRHAEKMEAVGQLAGGIAHDFNNLMQAVLGSVDIALTASPNPDVAESLQEIAQAGQRAADLTRQLLVFSRRQPLHRVPVDLNELIHDLMKLLRRWMPESVAIELKMDSRLNSLSADKTQLEQVVMNLCVNARDAMAEGGLLRIETENVKLTERDCEANLWAKPGSFVLLRVTDSGAGMAPEVLARVYEPFFTTKDSHRGTGLGLATVYGIAQQHGGFIQASSELGRGTTFAVYLPTEGTSIAKTRPAEPGVTPVQASGETVLIVEDEEIVRKSMIQIIGRAGYRTLAATNGREAIQVLCEHLEAVDIVVMDVVMPELGGPQAWEQMRVMRPDLGVVFVSGYADAQYRERIPANAEVLAKPFRAEQLLLAIRGKL